MSLFSIAAKFALKGASKRVPEDIMSGTIRRIKQEARLPEFKREAWWKDPERVEDYVPFKKVDDTQDVLRALGHKRYSELDKNPKKQIKEIEKDIEIFKQPTSKEGGQLLTKEEKNVFKNPELEKEARNLDEGLITLDEFKKRRDILKPRRTYGTVPKLYDEFDILGSIGENAKKYGIVGINRNIKADELVNTRFDIKAYENYGRYVVTVRKGNKVFGYSPTAILKNVKFAGNLDMRETTKVYDMGKKSFDIARGIREVVGKKRKAGEKSPFAVMEGKWQDVSPESTEKYAQRLFEKGKVNKAGETDKEWTEIGFDPSSKTSFYNRSTGEPIFSAEKVVQVGPMLLARGIKQATPEQLKGLRFSIQSGKELEGYKQGGQVSEGLSSIVYRDKGGKTKRKKKDKDFYADFDRKGKPTPELSNRIAISRLMEDLEWERIPKEVKRKRREEAEQWEDMKFIQEAMKEDKKGTQMFMPNQDLYKNPIFKDVVTKRKDGGGLSGIKKSININGQPHSLAWINPDEASALKAMGGSGRKVKGIPAYFYDDPGYMEEYLDVADEYQHDDDDLSKYQHIYDPSGEARIDTQFLHHDPSEDLAEDPEDRTTSFRGGAYDNRGLTSDIADWNLLYADSTSSADTSGGGDDEVTVESLLVTKGIPKHLTPYWNALKARGLSNEEAAARLAGMGTSGLADLKEAYDTGYSFGGPMGTMEGIQRDIASDYAKKLKLKEHLEKLEGLEGKELSEEKMEEQREELISAFRDHAKEIGGKFIPSTKFGGIMSGWEDTLKRAGKEDSLFHKGLGYLAPGALMTKVGAAGLNALTKAFGVIGEFITPEGLSYRVMDDGTLVAPDTYADTDEGTVERKPERKPPPLPPPSEPLEQKLTGMAAHYANLPKAASRQASLQSQFDILAATYGREQAAALLNQPVNIFA